MLHLSLLHLPRREPRWRILDPYDAHQLTWKAFSGIPRGDRPFLFSLDERGDYHALLVQSERIPDWSFLQGGATVQTKTFDPHRIPSDRPLRFFLRANPTVDRKGFLDGKKRRVAVGTNPAVAFQQMDRPKDTPTNPSERAEWRISQLRDWLQRKGVQGGFEVVVCEPGPIVKRRIARTENGRPKGRAMTFHEVEFIGRLSVTDRTLFARSCAHGIGRGRAFGFGLMMVRVA